MDGVKIRQMVEHLSLTRSRVEKGSILNEQWVPGIRGQQEPLIWIKLDA